MLESSSRVLGIRFSPVEVRGQVLSVSERGRAVAEPRLRALVSEREAHVRAVEARLLALETQRRRVEEAARLDARLPRRLGSERIEVTFDFMRERFISIVEADTLQVVDAGICLAGSDREVNLERLPSVIREAIEEIAHSHPVGPLGFSAEDETTMAALTEALGRPVRFSVVAPDGMVMRENGRDVRVTEEPCWAGRLRVDSGMRRRSGDLVL